MVAKFGNVGKRLPTQPFDLPKEADGGCLVFARVFRSEPYTLLFLHFFHQHGCAAQESAWVKVVPTVGAGRQIIYTGYAKTH